MTTRPQAVEVTLKLDPLLEPISGRVTNAGGHERSFSGWLDLMGVLDDARSRGTPPTDTSEEA